MKAPDILVFVGASLIGIAIALFFNWRFAIGWLGLVALVYGLALGRWG